MTFHNPEYLFGLLVLIPVIYWYIKEIHKSDASLQISSHRNLGLSPKSMKLRLLHLPFILRVFAVVLIVIAIARPQSSNSWKTENTEGIDIVISLDISGYCSSADPPGIRKDRIFRQKAGMNNCLAGRPHKNNKQWCRH